MAAEPRLVACATCGKKLDPLRASQVRFTGASQWFFCSAAHRDEFEISPTEAREPRLSEPEASGSQGYEERPSEQPSDEPLHEERVVSVPAAQLPRSNPTPLESSPLPPVSRSFEPLSDSKEPESREPSSSFRLAAFVLPLVVLLVSGGLTWISEESAWPALSAVLLLVLAQATSTRARATILRRDEAFLDRLKDHLRAPARRVVLSGQQKYEEVSPSALRPGEEIWVASGEYLVADGSVVEGEADVCPWLESSESLTASVGSKLAAGAFVRSGAIRVVCSKTGVDRALAPLLGGRDSPLEERTLSARLVHRTALQGAPAVGALTGLVAWVLGASYADVLAVGASVWGSLGLGAACCLPALSARAELASAAKSGIAFPHESVLEAAGNVSATVFCARGTVLHGEPEVAEIHALRGVEDSRLLALAAGAESMTPHPIAAAVTRAASQREVLPDASRSHDLVAGMGVVCVSSEGMSLVCGSRELLLRERVSIALAEETLRSLESRGLTALLVAEDSHLVGVLALQDSLRVGAKASVQRLLDERIEPVLLSGDSRATTEAVAKALCCEHVRPEVPAARRAQEIASLIEGGASVAVVGTSPRDDAALGAADVPVVLEGATTSRGDSPHPHERSVGLLGGRVLLSVEALLAARRIRHSGMVLSALQILPAFLAALATSTQLSPVFAPPMVALLAQGTALGWYRRHLKRIGG